MQLLELLRTSLGSLRANLMRSALTMLGIIIGVAAVIAMAALGNGAEAGVQQRIAKLGTTLLQINSARIAQFGVAVQSPVRLTASDADFLRAKATYIDELMPQQDRGDQVVFRRQNTNAQIVGATPNFPEVRRYALAAGRFFTAKEDSARLRLAVLGADAATALGFGAPEEAVGDTVRIGGEQFAVVGVLTAKGAAFGFGETDNVVIIPFETGRFRFFGTPYLNDIFVTATSEQTVSQAMAEVTQLLRKAHRLRAEQPDDFRIRSSDQFLETLSGTTQTFALLLAGIAMVSLVVGGIGIMNIMLVAVTERTREIGIRKALGATKRAILLQFLVEAVVLCLVGGVVGAGVGIATAVVLHAAMGWSTVVGPDAVALAAFFSGTIGVVFGVWPAARAASLNPIEALRYE
jgi:putative ABC transport system permease protein